MNQISADLGIPAIPSGRKLSSVFRSGLQLMAQVPAPSLAASGGHRLVMLARQDDRHEQADALRRQHLAPVRDQLLVGLARPGGCCGRDRRGRAG